jgi:hypothetical protein
MQRVFLSYTYAPHPQYVDETEQLKRRVSDVIESMEPYVTTGEDLGGHGLSAEIKERIERLDALSRLSHRGKTTRVKRSRLRG